MRKRHRPLTLNNSRRVEFLALAHDLDVSKELLALNGITVSSYLRHCLKVLANASIPQQIEVLKQLEEFFNEDKP